MKRTRAIHALAVGIVLTLAACGPTATQLPAADDPDPNWTVADSRAACGEYHRLVVLLTGSQDAARPQDVGFLGSASGMVIEERPAAGAAVEQAISALQASRETPSGELLEPEISAVIQELEAVAEELDQPMTELGYAALRGRLEALALDIQGSSASLMGGCERIRIWLAEN